MFITIGYVQSQMMINFHEFTCENRYTTRDVILQRNKTLILNAMK